jgi:hypothetical protein
MWSLVQKPYHFVLDLQYRGTTVLVCTLGEVRMPAEFTGTSWETFEPEAVSKFVEWVRQHVLDIGSSLGIYSALALCLSH